MAGGAEVVLQGLALLSEALAEEGVEAWGVNTQFFEARCKLQAEDGGVDVWRWGEGGWGKGEEGSNTGVHLGGCRQEAVVADAGGGGDSISDFALHHQDSAGDDAKGAGGEELQQDIGSDVVGEVSDDVGGFSWWDESAEVGFQDVDFDDLDIWLVAEAEGEFGGEGAIQFEGDEPFAAAGEYLGDGSVAGANFDDGTLGHVAEGVHNGVAGGVVDKEVLTEFGLVYHGHPKVVWLV